MCNRCLSNAFCISRNCSPAKLCETRKSPLSGIKLKRFLLANKTANSKQNSQSGGKAIACWILQQTIAKTAQEIILRKTNRISLIYTTYLLSLVSQHKGIKHLFFIIYHLQLRDIYGWFVFIFVIVRMMVIKNITMVTGRRICLAIELLHRYSYNVVFLTCMKFQRMLNTKPIIYLPKFVLLEALNIFLRHEYTSTGGKGSWFLGFFPFSLKQY